jgi:hypothetical protein
MIVFGEAHLRRILGKYVAYYNRSRIHRALNKDAPFSRAVEHLGVITSRPVLGGFHHQYCRIGFSVHTAPSSGPSACDFRRPDIRSAPAALLVHQASHVGQDARPIHWPPPPFGCGNTVAGEARRDYAGDTQIPVLSMLSIFWPYGRNRWRVSQSQDLLKRASQWPSSWTTMIW